MSPRRKAVPSTHKHSRSSPPARGKLIAKEKTNKQSVRKRTVLDNHFHRTFKAQRLRPTPEREATLTSGGPKSAAATELGAAQLRTHATAGATQ